MKYLVFILCCSVACPSIATLHDDFSCSGNDVSDLYMKDNRFETEEEKKIREIFEDFAAKFRLSPSCFDIQKRRAFHNMVKRYGRDIAIKSFKFGEKVGVVRNISCIYE